IALRAASTGVGRTWRSSSVCHIWSIISASWRSCRRRAVVPSAVGWASTSESLRILSSTERREASVGHAVDLFGGVGEVEVKSERPDQVGGLLDGQGAEEFADLGHDVVRAPGPRGIRTPAGRFLGFLGEEADLLHEVQELRPVL